MTLLGAAAILVGFTAVVAPFLIAQAGDGRALRRREQLRRATPYTPPANSRPGDFDDRGRPW